jgi:hypothetical protein
LALQWATARRNITACLAQVSTRKPNAENNSSAAHKRKGPLVERPFSFCLDDKNDHNGSRMKYQREQLIMASSYPVNVDCCECVSGLAAAKE